MKGVIISESGQVKVWSTIGMKVPVPGLDYTMLEFSFGHERWAKSGSNEDIANATRLADDFNERQLDKQLRKLLRQIRRIDAEISDDPPKKKGKKAKQQSTMDRVRGRLKE